MSLPQPFIDSNHRKWLHLRVRAPLPALINSAAASTSFRTAWNPNEPAIPNLRRLQDGRWTLAFSDESRALAARQLLDNEAEKLRESCQQALCHVVSKREPDHSCDPTIPDSDDLALRL